LEGPEPGDRRRDVHRVHAAGRAVRLRPPTVLLAVTGFADFRSAHFTAGFSHCRTDVPAGLAAKVLFSLPAAFLRRHLRLEDTLAAAVSDRLALVRVREYLWCLLDRRFPGSYSVFYAPRVNYHPWELGGRSGGRGFI